MAKYLDATDTAKIIRKNLKTMYPNTVFKVKTRKYSGGASVDISWIDGPAQKEIEELTSWLSGSGFDGSIDLKFSNNHWMLPCGNIVAGGTNGTENAGGRHASVVIDKPHPEAVPVRLGADFIFCNKRHSVAALRMGVRAMYEKWGGFKIDSVQYSDDHPEYGAHITSEIYLENAGQFACDQDLKNLVRQHLLKTSQYKD